MQRANILDMNIEELQGFMGANGFPKYRAKQVFGWIYKGIEDFFDMSNIPADLRALVSQNFYNGIPGIVKKQVSKLDGTAKYLLKLTDGSLIETVLLIYDYGYTLCISSQVGCRMGCSFCASTRGGLIRDLSPGEMIGQILAVQKDANMRISNIVVMGSGEPLDNYDNLIKFLHLANRKEGLNIGLRHITISTCGLVPEIDRLAEEGLPVTLSVSLHAADDETRKNLMPIARKYKIEDIIDACRRYTSKTGRRVTFEYAMIRNVNDSDGDAGRLADLLKNMICHVNLIPVNPISENKYKQPTRERIDGFKDLLIQNGISATVRRELGRDIDGACGQLRAGYLEGTRH